jgi:hypothetical protein
MFSCGSKHCNTGSGSKSNVFVILYPATFKYWSTGIPVVHKGIEYTTYLYTVELQYYLVQYISRIVYVRIRAPL